MSLPMSHFVTHPRSPKSTSHISDFPSLVGLVQKARTKSLCTNSISIARGWVCPGWFLSVPPSVKIHLLQQKAIHITLNFRFHMSENKFISGTSHAFDASPVTNCHTFSDTFPLERDVLYGRPLTCSSP